MTAIDTILYALAHPVRREALRLLGANSEICLCEFIERLGVPQPNMSRHMSMLRRAELVLDRKDARWVRYRRNGKMPMKVARIVDAVINVPEASSLQRAGRARAKREIAA